MWYRNHTEIKQCMDYWNLFDGMCYNKDGFLFFIQIKTNQWASEKAINRFMEKRHLNVIVINVKPRAIHTRFYFKALNASSMNI